MIPNKPCCVRAWPAFRGRPCPAGRAAKWRCESGLGFAVKINRNGPAENFRSGRLKPVTAGTLAIHRRKNAVPVLRSQDRFCIGQPLGFPNFADSSESSRSGLASCLALRNSCTTNKNGLLKQQTQQLQQLRKRPERHSAINGALVRPGATAAAVLTVTDVAVVSDL